jgi:Rps23 Pro-64 3,4-dihydroxylase Tpa1-like proline 4-hydroxylase
MKLIYSIPGKLYYIQNFLDYNTYKQIHFDAFKHKKNFHNVNSYLPSFLLHGLKKNPKSHVVDHEYNPIKKLKILLQNNQYFKIPKDLEYCILFHSMNDGSGINWHDDLGHEYGITYYINRRWNLKFGGEFMFTGSEGHGFIPVVGNSLVIVKSPLNHKVSNITKPLVSRKTIQIFVNKI